MICHVDIGLAYKIGVCLKMPCWIGDFGFVTELDRLDARQAFICELYEMLDSVSER